jgi:hypothetical protein
VNSAVAVITSEEAEAEAAAAAAQPAQPAQPPAEAAGSEAGGGSGWALSLVSAIAEELQGVSEISQEFVTDMKSLAGLEEAGARGQQQAPEPGDGDHHLAPAPAPAPAHAPPPEEQPQMQKPQPPAAAAPRRVIRPSRSSKSSLGAREVPEEEQADAGDAAAPAQQQQPPEEVPRKPEGGPLAALQLQSKQCFLRAQRALSRLSAAQREEVDALLAELRDALEGSNAPLSLSVPPLRPPLTNSLSPRSRARGAAARGARPRPG